MKQIQKISIVTIFAFLLFGALVNGYAQEIQQIKASPYQGSNSEETFALNTFKTMHSTGFKITGKKKLKGETLIVDQVLGPYITIQSAIDAAADGDKILIKPGTYGGFQINGMNNLTVKAYYYDDDKSDDNSDDKSDDKSSDDDSKDHKEKGDVIITGAVIVVTYRGTYMITIGVVESSNIEICGFTVLAGLTDPFTIAYFNSTGKVKDNDVSGNTGNSNPGNSIAAFGTYGVGKVNIEKNYIHNYGKIGILVNSWDPAAGAYAPDGIYAEIKRNTITGTDFADYMRVQDGIQVTNGGSAKIEDNDISGNFQTGGSYWTCDGILLYDAFEVKTKKNRIHNNQMGIAIQKYVYSAKFDNDKIEYNEWGIYTWNWIDSIIEVKKAKIKHNEYGWVNWDTDGIVFEQCNLEKNETGMYASAWSTVNPTATFNKCKITKNKVIDVEHDNNTLIFHKTKYGTYENYGGGILIVD